MRYIFDDLKVVCNVIKTRKKWIRKLYYLSQSASRDNSVNFLYLNESLLINTSVIHLIIYNQNKYLYLFRSNAGVHLHDKLFWSDWNRFRGNVFLLFLNDIQRFEMFPFADLKMWVVSMRRKLSGYWVFTTWRWCWCVHKLKKNFLSSQNCPFLPFCRFKQT